MTETATALVTGAARGIGRATALAFAEAGYDVVLADVDTGVAAEVAAEIEDRDWDGNGNGTGTGDGDGTGTGDGDGTGTGTADIDADRRAVVVELDVSDPASVDEGIDAALDAVGAIDVLVNNAGIQTDDPFLELSVDDWDAVLGVNLRGTFLVAQRVATAMVERDVAGRIVNVSSVHQSLPRRNHVHYDASKAGVRMLTRDMAFELADHRINVNAVAPGAVETPLNQDLLDDPETREAITALVPWGRWATPEEVADVVRYLGHDAPSYVTGSCLEIDGGLGLAGVGNG
jgi:NAD(P)-dependent dehydrogenase (short-subunit alcohol dehydrogenase family)